VQRYLTYFNQQDLDDGAQLAGEWGTREAFVSVVTTNLPMLFPLLKTLLKPLFDTLLSSNQGSSKHPSGFRTIGGGDGESGTGRKQRTVSKPQRSSNLSLNESEEHIVNNIKMQNLEAYAGTAVSTDRPSEAILVSSEFRIVDDRASQPGDKKKEIIQDNW
jgi:hypothetical protein